MIGIDPKILRSQQCLNSLAELSIFAGNNCSRNFKLSNLSSQIGPTYYSDRTVGNFLLQNFTGQHKAMGFYAFGCTDQNAVFIEKGEGPLGQLTE